MTGFPGYGFNGDGAKERAETDRWVEGRIAFTSVSLIDGENGDDASFGRGGRGVFLVREGFGDGRGEPPEGTRGPAGALLYLCKELFLLRSGSETCRRTRLISESSARGRGRSMCVVSVDSSAGSTSSGLA